MQHELELKTFKSVIQIMSESFVISRYYKFILKHNVVIHMFDPR